MPAAYFFLRLVFFINNGSLYLGKLIKEGQEKGEVAKKGGIAGKHSNVKDTDIAKPKTLSEVGLTRNQSKDFQSIAKMPEEDFESELAIAKQESDVKWAYD